jgi:hypothetical protein
MWGRIRSVIGRKTKMIFSSLALFVSCLFVDLPTGKLDDRFVVAAGNRGAAEFIASRYPELFNERYRNFSGEIVCVETQRMRDAPDILVFPRLIECKASTACEKDAEIPVMHFPFLGQSIGPDPLWTFFISECTKMLNRDLLEDLDRRCARSMMAGHWCSTTPLVEDLEVERRADP